MLQRSVEKLIKFSVGHDFLPFFFIIFRSTLAVATHQSSNSRRGLRWLRLWLSPTVHLSGTLIRVGSPSACRARRLVARCSTVSAAAVRAASNSCSGVVGLR